jgi:hypothetical protein
VDQNPPRNPAPPTPRDDPAELCKRLATARSEFSRAVSLLEGRDLPEPRYSEESKLIRLVRATLKENADMRAAITDFWVSAAAAGMRLNPDCGAGLAAEVMGALLHLRRYGNDDAIGGSYVLG